MRSLFLVEAFDRAALDAALDAAADALVVALAGGVAPDPVLGLIEQARRSAAPPLIYLRLPAIEAEELDALLAAFVPAEPDGFLLGSCRGRRDVQHLGAKLAVHEALHGLDSATPVIAEAGSSAEAVLALDTFRGASTRLMGLVWNGEALAAELGIDPSATALGSPLVTARSLTLIAARATDICAIDGASPSGDPAAFRAACEDSRRDGFNAKLARSVAEVAVVNAVFDRAV